MLRLNLEKCTLIPTYPLCTKKYILFFVSHFWDRAPKTLTISWMTEVSFVLIRQLRVGSWMRVGHQKDSGMIRSLELLSLPTPSLSWEGRKAENRVNAPSCLWWRLHKNPHSTRFRSFQVGEHSQIPRVWPDPTQLHWDRSSCPQDPLRLYAPFHLAVHLYHFSYPLINWWMCFPEFCELL